MNRRYLTLASSLLGVLLILFLTTYYEGTQRQYFTGSASLNAVTEAMTMRPVSNSEWQYAAKIAPPDLMKQVIEENIEPDFSVDAGRMKVLKVFLPGQIAPLFLIDSRLQYECPPNGCSYHADPLCGTAGCQYFIYLKEGKLYRRVFKSYLKDLLPPELSFLRISEQLKQGLPCLEFTENINLIDSTYRTRRFCYNNQNFTVEE